MNIPEHKILLENFLNRWTIENVQTMTLDQYVNVNDKDTFCQWVETKTRVLGSSKGLSSIKFGIYKRKNKDKIPKNYRHDAEYSWLQYYSDDNRNNVYNVVHHNILQIIDFSQKGNFYKIDDIQLPNLFKWKVAFLYSNERLVPIYNKEILHQIGRSLGMIITKKTKISEIHYAMIDSKPINLDVHEYMWYLFGKYGNKTTEIKLTRKKRKSSITLNTSPQTRNFSVKSYIAQQKHNLIQLALRDKLIEKYGYENVSLEENYVDIKLYKPKCVVFFEVKTYSYAGECIREALGQIISYAYYDTDNRKKISVVIGINPLTKVETEYLCYLQKILNLDFHYFHFSENIIEHIQRILL